MYNVVYLYVFCLNALQTKFIIEAKTMYHDLSAPNHGS